jgi:hypothetical protein
MTKTELKKMTVADVLKTPEYVANLEKLLNLLWESRQKARFKAHSNNQELKAHPIDNLHEAGIWQPQEFIFEYMAVIDKESQFSSAARAYIREVGTSAYVTTIKNFQNENKGKKRVRKDKQ